jgi:Antitoxin Xre/MbcA/ParS C-terminal toxin-binding domain
MPLRPNGNDSLQETARALRAAAQQTVFGEASNIPPHRGQEGETTVRLVDLQSFLRVREAHARWHEFRERSLQQVALDWPGAEPTLAPHGLIEAFVKTCQRWRLSERDQSVLLGYGTNPPLAREITSGRYRELPQDVRDRVGYIVGISVGLGTVFDEAVRAELDWLRRPHPKLANRSPLNVMLMGHMAQLITVSDLVAEERALR